MKNYLEKIRSLSVRRKKQIVWAIITILGLLFFSLLLVNFHPGREISKRRSLKDILRFNELQKEIKKDTNFR